MHFYFLKLFSMIECGTHGWIWDSRHWWMFFKMPDDRVCLPFYQNVVNTYSTQTNRETECNQPPYSDFTERKVKIWIFCFGNRLNKMIESIRDKYLSVQCRFLSVKRHWMLSSEQISMNIFLIFYSTMEITILRLF